MNDIIDVIDDDEAARDSLEFLLRSAGLNVRTHNSGSAFLDNYATALAVSSQTSECPG